VAEVSTEEAGLQETVAPSAIEEATDNDFRSRRSLSREHSRRRNSHLPHRRRCHHSDNDMCLDSTRAEATVAVAVAVVKAATVPPRRLPNPDNVVRSRRSQPRRHIHRCQTLPLARHHHRRRRPPESPTSNCSRTRTRRSRPSDTLPEGADGSFEHEPGVGVVAWSGDARHCRGSGDSSGGPATLVRAQIRRCCAPGHATRGGFFGHATRIR
jgi:hypothetical protein